MSAELEAGLRIAVTGAHGRLGAALLEALRTRTPAAPLAWDLPDHDLGDPASAARLVERDQPDVVVHCAAWTDVDGCARQPDLAMRRNGVASGELAEACAAIGADLVLVSTNEVFDGERRDGRGYGPADAPNPRNAHGASKLAGERAAAAAFAPAGRAREGRRGRAAQLGIVRTSWLFGRGAPDFPHKIIVAAERAAERGEPLRLVADEWASPTYAGDLAAGIIELIAAGPAGIHHLVNEGVASRADWGRDVLARVGLDVPAVDIAAALWIRDSRPPRWGVLAPTPLPSGGRLRVWREAMIDYSAVLETGLGVR